ncbi:MAG: nuclear transport factor 2 family protein [Dehalococcoidia bacterium]
MQFDPALRRRLLELYAAMSSGNAASVEAFYSLQADSVFIGTDASEYWTDSRRHNEDVRPFFDGAHGRYSWHPGDALALVEGSVGWTVDRPAVVTPDGETLPARVTLVWHREDDGVWRVVHSHASLGREA